MVTKTLIYLKALPDTDKKGQITLLQPGMFSELVFRQSAPEKGIGLMQDRSYTKDTYLWEDRND